MSDPSAPSAPPSSRRRPRASGDEAMIRSARRIKESFAAEERGLDAFDHLDVVVDRRLQGDEASGIDAELFSRLQIHLHERAAGVKEDQAVAGEALQNEALAAEEAGADLFREGDVHVRAACGTEKAVFLRDQFAAPLFQITDEDLARNGRRESDVTANVRRVAEERDEERLTREHSLAGAEQLAEETGTLRVRVEGRLELDAVLHIHHRARLGEDRFARIERYDHALQVIADELVVDYVRRHLSPRGGCERSVNGKAIGFRAERGGDPSRPRPQRTTIRGRSAPARSPRRSAHPRTC
jgi:hypothetical protein